MALLDLLGRRWTLRLLWELRRDAPSFRALQARCHGMSSSVLSQRLSELRAAGIAAPGPDGGYALTGEGRALLEALAPIDRWARRWADRQASRVEPRRRKGSEGVEPRRGEGREGTNRGQETGNRTRATGRVPSSR